MKKILKIFTIEVIALYTTLQAVSGMVFDNYFEGIIITGIALAIGMIFLKPIVNILLLPLTLATLGLFRFISHAIVLWIVDTALIQFKIVEFNFPGLTSQYLDLPSVHYTNVFMAYFAFSLTLSIITGVLNWLLK